MGRRNPSTWFSICCLWGSLVGNWLGGRGEPQSTMAFGYSKRKLKLLHNACSQVFIWNNGKLLYLQPKKKHLKSFISLLLWFCLYLQLWCVYNLICKIVILNFEMLCLIILILALTWWLFNSLNIYLSYKSLLLV